MESQYKDLFERKNYLGETIPDNIFNRRIAFDFPARQAIIGYINLLYPDNEGKRADIIRKCIKFSEFDEEKMPEYLGLILREKDNVILSTLCEYHIDVNDYDIPFDISRIKRKKFKERQGITGLAIIDSDTLLKINEGYRPEFIWEPLVFKNGVNIMGAERATGKTRSCIALAQCVIRGFDNFLGYPVRHWGDVLYVNMEMSSAEFSIMVRQVEKYYENIQGKKFRLLTLNTKDFPTYKLDDLIDRIIEARPILVIIDSFKVFNNKLMTEYNQKALDNNSVMKLFDFTEQVKKNYRTTFLITNHTNKGTKGMKGHSDLMYGPGGLVDLSDHTFLLRKTNEPGKKLIIPDKCRFFKEGVYGNNMVEMVDDQTDDSLHFELVEEYVNEEDYMTSSPNGKRYGPELKDKALELHRQGKTTREIGAELSINHATIARWIK